MLTFTKTVTTTESKTLATPAEIADHIHAEYRLRIESAPFKPGDRVRITRRNGIHRTSWWARSAT